MIDECTRAEILAGAIALNEASDAERDAYRRHLAGCADCIDALGGEREIERVMATVAAARDAERWEPAVRVVPAARRGARWWPAAAGTLAAAFALSFGIHALVASHAAPLVMPAREVAAATGAFHVVLERRPASAPQRVAAAHAAPAHSLVVVHNVVTLAPPGAEPVRLAATRPAKAVPAATAAPKAVEVAQAEMTAMPSSHDERSIAALQTAATAAPPEGHAESIAMVPTVVRDVVPLGGDDAIVPHPSAIAYDLGAEGTTAVDIAVDDRGTPTKCTVSKTSGYAVLDVSVCKAAMRARYQPRTINGRAVASVYHDAFTFRAGDRP